METGIHSSASRSRKDDRGRGLELPLWFSFADIPISAYFLVKPLQALLLPDPAPPTAVGDGNLVAELGHRDRRVFGESWRVTDGKKTRCEVLRTHTRRDRRPAVCSGTTFAAVNLLPWGRAAAPNAATGFVHPGKTDGNSSAPPRRQKNRRLGFGGQVGGTADNGWPMGSCFETCSSYPVPPRGAEGRLCSGEVRAR